MTLTIRRTLCRVRNLLLNGRAFGTSLLLTFAITGCSHSSTDPFSAEVADKTGNHRLVLKYASAGVGPDVGSKAFEFESLDWETRAGASWTNRIVISKADFNAGTTNEKWVTELHSLDPITGIAVIKVAESPPATSNNRPVTYSWREWNMTNNQQVRIVRMCSEPFEPFSGKRIKLR